MATRADSVIDLAHLLEKVNEDNVSGSNTPEYNTDT